MFPYLSQLSVTMWKNHACDPLHRTRGRFRARHIHVRELLDSALTSTKSRRQVSYPWIAYRVWNLLEARIKGCAGCCAKPLRRKVQKFQYIKCSLSPRRRGTKRRFRKHLRRGGGRNVVGEGGDATMTTPPDAHQYPRVGCHIFLPIQMTPPRGPIPAS